MDTNLRLTSIFEANAHGFIQWDFARRTDLEWRHANRHDPLCVRTLQPRLGEQVADKSKAAHRSFSAGYLAHSRSLGFKVSCGMDHHVHNGLNISILCLIERATATTASVPCPIALFRLSMPKSGLISQRPQFKRAAATLPQ